MPDENRPFIAISKLSKWAIIWTLELAIPMKPEAYPELVHLMILDVRLPENPPACNGWLNRHGTPHCLAFGSLELHSPRHDFKQSWGNVWLNTATSTRPS